MDNNNDKPMKKKPLFLPPLNIPNNSHNNKIHQLAASKTNNNNEKNDENNVIDYKNISLSMTGEISSANIHRNNLTRKKPNIFYMEDENEAEDDDEQFVSNMKKIIDKNYRMQDKENYSIRDLQSKLYLSRKKKCAFSDEDQNVMKRFKRSADESRTLCVAPRALQSENVASVSNCECINTTVTNAPQFIPTVASSIINTNFRNNTNQFLFHATSKKNDTKLMTPNNTKTVTTETEIEQLNYYEMQCFTPPQRDNNVVMDNYNSDNL